MVTMVGMMVEFKAKSQEIDTTLKRVQSELDGVKKKTTDVNSTFAGATKKINEFGSSIVSYSKYAALGITGASTALLYMISKTGAEIDKITDEARGLGIAASEFKHMADAASLSGVEIGTLEMLMRKANISISQAATGNEDLIRSFKSLGISLNDLKNKSPTEQITLIISALGKMKDETKANKAAFDIFGKSMSEALNLARDNFASNVKEMEKLSIGLTDAQRKAVDAFGDAQTKLGVVWGDFKEKVTADVSPAFTKILDFITKTIEDMGGIDSAADKFATGIVSAVKTAVSSLNGLLDTLDTIRKTMLFIQARGLETEKESMTSALDGTEPGTSKYGLKPSMFSDRNKFVDAVTGSGQSYVPSIGYNMQLTNLNNQIAENQKQLNEIEKSQNIRRGMINGLNDSLSGKTNSIPYAAATSDTSPLVDQLGIAAKFMTDSTRMAGEAANRLATNFDTASSKLDDALSIFTKNSGQEVLNRVLKSNDNGEQVGTKPNDKFDRLIKDIYTKALNGTGGNIQTGSYSVQQADGTYKQIPFSNRVTSAKDDFETLKTQVMASANGSDIRGIAGYIGAIDEIGKFLSRFDPNSNKVKLDIEVKTEEGFILKIAQSKELEQATQKALINVATQAARQVGK